MEIRGFETRTTKHRTQLSLSMSSETPLVEPTPASIASSCPREKLAYEKCFQDWFVAPRLSSQVLKRSKVCREVSQRKQNFGV